MKNNQAVSLVLPIADTSATLQLVGGKGASLARLAAAGMPVPPGFHVTTAAYQNFVRENRLQEQILEAVETAHAGRSTFAEASHRIENLFLNSVMPNDVAIAIRQAYHVLGGGEIAVAVRSSATAEDLPEMSFAGQQETYLNIRGEKRVLEAVQRCWASLWTARAIDYRARNHISSEDVSLAVVVQELVPADAAGILFTANPLNGVSDQVIINATWGLGEAIVGGQVTPDTITVDKVSRKVIEQKINEKNLMTVRTPEGTHEEKVPENLRARAVLTEPQVLELTLIGIKIEKLYDQPMDIEWAIHDGRVFVVQARPITTMHGHTPTKGEWNDSLSGDYLWTNGNLGEAIPDVMTPCTWSLVQIFMADAMATSSVPPYLGYGNIGGRFYMNLSVAASLSAVFGINQKRFAKLTEEVFGRLPEGMEIPLIPLSRWRVLRLLLPISFRLLRRVRRNLKRMPEFLKVAPEYCDKLHSRIKQTWGANELLELWQNEILPFFHDCCYMLEAAGRQDGSALVMVRRKLQKLAGEDDANALLTGLNAGTNQLASLGPLIGLTQLIRGEIDRATFARQYGHRSSHEFEVSIARPAEDPDWIDQQLAGLRGAKVNVTELLERQEKIRALAWERFIESYPRKEASIRRQIDRWASAARNREVARSEVIRAFGVLRGFVLRAGEITGNGEDLFFLSIDEILSLLGGDETVLTNVYARRGAYRRYCELPPYPALIRGHFDPFEWAADPERRSDIYDARGYNTSRGNSITGFAGSIGVVEGRARVLSTVQEGELLQPGEILVTTVTNIGWTPIFPRAAAVITDVGAPLSHAAIVARELGIPAVVGCGNATMRIHTGDFLRVNGGKGTVEILT